MVFTTKMYSKFLKFLLAALYVFGVQGRPKALYKMSYKNFMNAWKNGKQGIESRDFKTVKKYDYQVINLYLTCITILKDFVHVYRSLRFQKASAHVM